jgi:2-polyprenyl-3-methyl-5-hydroxy-6-metoxy-1,4-benzoquinol methylase
MELELASALCAEADQHSELRPAPAAVAAELAEAIARVDAIADASTVGTHADYFRSSRERYAHYAALAKLNLPPHAHVLDVGNAPGHFAFLLTQMGHRVTGVNLNAEWRRTYPDPAWLDLFSVTECDIEREALPFPDGAFDAVFFTEVLEHIAITDPVVVLGRLRRVLRPGGVLFFSTPNICNLSNVIALLLGVNIFWPREIFYGSLDRHNREWTPKEVREVFDAAGFDAREFYGMNDHSNWRGGGAADRVYALLAQLPREHALLLNTTVGVFTVRSSAPEVKCS